jgi:SAM-dependent methyltransferase
MSGECWHMTDEADRIIGLYQRHAHEFDRERWRNLFERPWLDRFAALLPRGGSILDLGCGSGNRSRATSSKADTR